MTRRVLDQGPHFFADRILRTVLFILVHFADVREDFCHIGLMQRIVVRSHTHYIQRVNLYGCRLRIGILVKF